MEGNPKPVAKAAVGAPAATFRNERRYIFIFSHSFIANDQPPPAETTSAEGCQYTAKLSALAMIM